MIIQGKDITFSISNGGAYSQIMCNASCKMRISTDTLEKTFEGDGAYRGFIPNKHTIVIDGNGPVVMGTEFTAPQITEIQLARTTVNWTFEGTDGTNSFLYSGQGFFTETAFDGTVNQAADCAFTLQVTGTVNVNDTPPPGGSGQIGQWEYIATGGETTISDSELLNALILDVERSGIGVQVITVGSPTGSQVKSTPSGGSLQFGTALGAGEWINVLYLE